MFETNHKAWSGDHCVDPPLVPGVLFANRKIDAADPGSRTSRPVFCACSASIRRHGWKASRYSSCSDSRGASALGRVRLAIAGELSSGDRARHRRHGPGVPRSSLGGSTASRCLRREGEFQRLATTIPPQSPVAWSTFITGTSPERHGIYDFVHRNPRTLLPFSSLGETDPARGITLGGWRIPLGSRTFIRSADGAAFWESLKSRGIPVTLVKVPMDYPPADDADDALSGLGVPDMQGTFGTFTFFTDDSVGNHARCIREAASCRSM